MLHAYIVFSNENSKYSSYMFIKHKDLKEIKEEAIKRNKQGYRVSIEVYDKGKLVYSMELNHI